MQRFASYLVVLGFGIIVGAGTVASAATNNALVQRLKGKILLRVEHKGEAWYVNPDNGLRYFLGRPSDAYQLMRTLGLGTRDRDLFQIPTAPGHYDQNRLGSSTYELSGRLIAFNLPNGWSAKSSNRAQSGVDVTFAINTNFEAQHEGLLYEAVGDERGPGITSNEWIDSHYPNAIGSTVRTYSGYDARVFSVSRGEEATTHVVMIVGNTVLDFFTGGILLDSGLLDSIRYTGY